MASHFESNERGWWKPVLPFLLCLQLSALFVGAQQSQPLAEKNRASTNKIVVYRGIRIDRNPLPIRYPVVLIEVHNELVFDWRNQFHALRIGTQEFPHANLRSGWAVFELTPEEFAKTQSGDEVTILYGATNPIKRKLLKNWYVGKLDKTEVDKRPVKTFEGSHTDQITPETPIITVTDDNMFPPHWRDAPIKAQATSLSKKKVSRTFHLIYNILGRYYVSLLNSPKRVYLLSSLTLYGVKCDAAFSADTIYIVNSDEEEYTDEYLKFISYRAFANWLEKNHNKDSGAEVARFLPQRRPLGVMWADRSMKLVYQADERIPEYIYALENTGFMGVTLFKQFKHSPREDEITCLLRCRERSRRKALKFQDGLKEHEPLYQQTTVDSAPVWSHDGKQIAFQSSRDHDIAELYVMRVDGSKLRRLTHTVYSPSHSTVHSSAAWSPDDRQLAYLRGGSRLSIVNADGTGQRDVPIESTSLFLIGWTHDGRILILVERSDRSSRSVYSILPNGTGLTRLIDGAKVVGQAFLSPNKNLIAITAMGNLIIKDLKTNTVSQSIISLGIREVSWSPDSTQIAYQDHHSLVVRDIRSGATRYSSIGRHNQVISGISWSPDGKQIAYVGADGLALGREGVTELRVVNADGTGERRITADGFFPTWSPDGKYIVFSRRQARMFLIKPDGSGEQYLASGVWAKWLP